MSKSYERLMVLYPEALSGVIQKGEVTSRYFNPGNLFKEVHVVLMNDDQPDLAAAQKMVGDAKLFIHNAPTPSRFFIRSFGWRPFLMKSWAKSVVQIATDVQPQLIRCHGVSINAFAAAEVKRVTGIPYIISLHVNPDEDIRWHKKKEGTWQSRLQYRMSVAMENYAVCNADCVIGVYNFLKPYAQRHGAQRIEVIYNAVNPENLIPKENYELNSPVRILLPGRQFPKKDPSPVIEAIAELDNVNLILVGDGDYHERLKQLATDLGVMARCEFIKSIDNDTLCRTLKDYDILISVNEYGGVSKVELEASFVGVPVITNDHPLEDKPEILEDNCEVVDGTKESYKMAIQHLMDDGNLRKVHGTKLRDSVQEYTSDKMERRYVDLYCELANGRGK